jgi:TetR/AcrR family transcriptional regulator, transcriptional repressor for nem operon
MKKSKAETAKTRQRIIEVASQAIRTKGIEATGVAEIMAAAGLTHGGFYRHFDSKEELVTEAIALSRKDFVAGTAAAADRGADAMVKHFQEYATPGYRDDIGSGCPLAANGSELVRADAKTRHLATEGFRLILEKAAPFMHSRNDEGRTETAISVMTHMIGALTMARLVDEQILEVTRKRIAGAFGRSSSEPRDDSVKRSLKPQKKRAKSKMQ